MKSLQMTDYTDREIVAILHDCAGPEGYATNLDMVLMFGGKEDDVHLRRCVGARLAYMARELKLVKRHPKERTTWKLTPEGEQLRDGTLKKVVLDQLNSMSEADQLALTTALTRRSVIEGSKRSATMTRRIVTYGIANRNGRRR